MSTCGVALGGGEAGVAEQLLDRPQVGAPGSSRWVAKLCRSVCGLQRRASATCFTRRADEGADAAVGEPPAPGVDEERRPSGAGAARAREPGASSASRARPPKSTIRSLRPLPSTRSMRALEVDLADVEAHELGAADAGARRAAPGWPGPAPARVASPGTSRSDCDLGLVEERRGCASPTRRGEERRAGFASSRPSRHRKRKKVRRPASLRAEDDFFSPRRWSSREEAADQQVVGVLGTRPRGPARRAR